MKKTLLFLAFLVACGGEEAPDVVVVSTSKPVGKMAADPGTAFSVADAKEELPTEEIIVVGRIHRMVKGYATFTLMDDKLDFCGEVQKEDTCKTPWDYCCSTTEELRQHRATVKVVDAEGKTLKVDLKSAGQIEELKTLVVKGMVAEGSDQKNLIIEAKGIYVEN